MPKLTKMYDIHRFKHLRSIDPTLDRPTLKQHFKTMPEYLPVPLGEKLVVQEINPDNGVYYFVIVGDEDDKKIVVL